MLSIANSLRLPFETTRRHVASLVERGLCRRDPRGVVLTVTDADPPLSSLATLAHDCLVRFLSDLKAVNALPPFACSTRVYSWQSGWRAAADLMLAVADTNRGTHHDRVDLVLFSTILCGNSRPVATDPVLARLHVTLLPTPPDALVRPVRTRVLTERLAIPEATVRRRLERLVGGAVLHRPEGLVINEAWLLSREAVATSVATWGNVRRLLVALANQSFPFHAPEAAYIVGRPDPVPLD